MAVNAGVEVTGVKELQKAVRRAKNTETTKALRDANKAAATVVKDKGKPKAPKLTGKLAASIKAVSSTRDAKVRAGTASRVPYAGPIHFGWPARGIRPNRFLNNAIRDNYGEIRDTYEDALRKVAALLESK